MRACPWRIVVSPMIPQDFPFCHNSSVPALAWLLAGQGWAPVFQTAADLGALVIAFVTLQSVYSYSDRATRISTVLSNVQGFPHLAM
jgi:hypothetical protein